MIGTLSQEIVLGMEAPVSARLEGLAASVRPFVGFVLLPFVRGEVETDARQFGLVVYEGFG